MSPKKRYTNLDHMSSGNSLHDLLRWQSERRKNPKDLSLSIEQAPSKETSRLFANRTVASITWIGHSTFLIQMNGLNMITDPVWASRMPIMKRLTKPGIKLNELPEIDAVLISHGHYDHLDFATIRRLKGKPTYFVPAGLGRAFKRRGYKKVVEGEWYDSFLLDDLTFTFVPAQHWTKRTLTDTNTSHWGGWIIESREHSVYFVGDTGYFRGFKEIAARFTIDTVLMPIGAYEPDWFMKVDHINPEDAVKAFLELNGKTFIPMHYGAYHLADDTGPEAIERLDAEWNRQQLNASQLRKLLIGETHWL
ncbi:MULTISPECIES: MBL fold metallo-hydrolase [unclassified Sporosarcina]|uniref:MBL fold metallo-hydrolase n=1 Tax=unclassified Sporosarcina TaxID=2647733 RepID=UPI00203C098B|nr:MULTISPECIES: MBL fold metallo-hydrolase [unclassified Sporosarcina]GKV64490.1 membrane protein [Sporosarcina sp. NCCP-2331]GLB57522.1 membrane protein [Sporosarcina sp. NCCP-2378]